MTRNRKPDTHMLTRKKILMRAKDIKPKSTSVNDPLRSNVVDLKVRYRQDTLLNIAKSCLSAFVALFIVGLIGTLLS